MEERCHEYSIEVSYSITCRDCGKNWKVRERFLKTLMACPFCGSKAELEKQFV
jgi:DNA-directed RNA polymerase subunit RPC12/RpoP